MTQQHPNYPPLLLRPARLGPLLPYPIAWRQELTNRLQARGVEISRAFLALCNLNLVEYASIEDHNHILGALRESTNRQITALSQSLSLGLRECRLLNSLRSSVNVCGQLVSPGIWMVLLTFLDLTIGGRVAASASASTADAPTPPLLSSRRSHAAPSTIIFANEPISVGTASRQAGLRTQQRGPPTGGTHISVFAGAACWLSPREQA